MLRKHRLGFPFLALLVAMSLTASVAFAARVHFKGGNPKFTDSGGPLAATKC